MEGEHPHEGRCFRCGKEWPTRLCCECVTPPVPRVVALCVGGIADGWMGSVPEVCREVGIENQHYRWTGLHDLHYDGERCAEVRVFVPQHSCRAVYVPFFNKEAPDEA